MLCPTSNLTQSFHFIVLKYSSEKCNICHGDISLNNIVINRVWDDKTDDDNDDDSDNNSGDKSDTVAPNVDTVPGDSTPNVDVSATPNVNVNESSTSNQPADSFSGAGDDYHALDVSGSRSTPPLDSPLTEMSSSFTTITDRPSIYPRPYGVTIDYDNSFSLDDVNGYQINSVRQTLQLYTCSV